MKKNDALTLLSITIYAFGFIAAFFYSIGINPTSRITSQQSYYLGVFVGITTAGVLLAMPIVAWGILVWILGADEKKEGE